MPDSVRMLGPYYLFEDPMTLKSTPLNSVHRALGAKMVDFGGWDMPVNYGSQIEEHHVIRTDAGMFDVSHMCVVDLQGENVRHFLRGLLANNVDKLQAPGKALYSCMLNPQGGVIDDLIVYFFDETWFRLVVNAGTAEKDLAWIRERNETSGAGLSITPRRADLSSDGIALVAVQGPNARAKFWDTVPAAREASEGLKPFNAAIVKDTPFGELMVARTGYTGEDGFEIGVAATQVEALWNALAASGVKPAGLGARDTLRLEAGMNLYGQDMDDTVSPLDAGLAWTVDLVSERDFVGKTALQRGQQQQFVGLILREKGGILRAHQKVVAASGNAGEITSGTFSPSMQQAVALARVPMDVAIGDTVHVEIRDKKLAASVVKLPFVRHGKVLAA